ncbi:MAG: thioredoxin domain-containing protein [Cyanobacteria bacterium P01_F01_bin.53]
MAIPIPSRSSGYKLGNANAPIVVEMFLDLECPFSKRGWNHVMEVARAYGPDQVHWIFQLMTLGNHRQSWDATKAVIAIAGKTAEADSAQKFVDFTSYLYSRQEEFANEAWKDKTQTEFHDLLAEFAVTATAHTDKAAFIELLNSKEIYAQARIPARFATVRGVWSTPTFFINGAEATQLSSGSSVEAWKAVIDPLLSAS